MKERTVAKVYAEALFKSARGSGVEKVLAEQLSDPRMFDELRSEFLEIYKRELGEKTVRATTAVELSPEMREKLKQSFKEKFGGEIELKLEVDESIIGGMIVEVGDELIDCSVRRRLQDLRRTLI